MESDKAPLHSESDTSVPSEPSLTNGMIRGRAMGGAGPHDGAQAHAGRGGYMARANSVEQQGPTPRRSEQQRVGGGQGAQVEGHYGTVRKPSFNSYSQPPTHHHRPSLVGDRCIYGTAAANSQPLSNHGTLPQRHYSVNCGPEPPMVDSAGPNSEFNPATLGRGGSQRPSTMMRRGSCCSRISIGDRNQLIRQHSTAGRAPPSHHGSMQDLAGIYGQQSGGALVLYDPMASGGMPPPMPPPPPMQPYWWQPMPPPLPPPSMQECFYGTVGGGGAPIGAAPPMDFETFRRMMKEVERMEKGAKRADKMPSACAQFCCGGVAQLLWTIIAITCLGFVSALILALYII